MKKLLVCLLLLQAAFVSAFSKKDGADKNIAVFIPGVRAGSAIYDMLAKGVEDAARDWEAASGKKVSLNIVEGGYDQSAWENKVTELAAQTHYDVIISSNPSLPDIVVSVLKKFPHQKFMLFDGEMHGSGSVYSLRYNQREQSVMAGHLAALITEEAGGAKKIGLIAAQEYPVMNNIILPAYLEGARLENGAFSVDFRIVGNWFDAHKAADLAQEMFRGGIKVVLAISGGANEGILQAASEQGGKVIWFDTNGYAQKEGVVAGSAVLHQDKAVYEKTMLFLNGALRFGVSETGSVRGGYVDFDDTDPLYAKTVSATVRQKQNALLEKIRSGALVLD